MSEAWWEGHYAGYNPEENIECLYEPNTQESEDWHEGYQQGIDDI